MLDRRGAMVGGCLYREKRGTKEGRTLRIHPLSRVWKGTNSERGSFLAFLIQHTF